MILQRHKHEQKDADEDLWRRTLVNIMQNNYFIFSCKVLTRPRDPPSWPAGGGNAPIIDYSPPITLEEEEEDDDDDESSESHQSFTLTSLKCSESCE